MTSLHRLFFATAVVISVAAPASAEIVGKAVEYQHGGLTFEGWHAYDTALTGKGPSILLVHQWTGLGDNEKRRAKMLAELGYNVFAVDVYGKGVRPQPPAAGAEAGKYKGDRKLFRERLRAGLDVLLADSHTDPARVVALGYCFGGTGALELARDGAALRGAVSFHGGLSNPTPADASRITGEVLALHGADDPYVPKDEVEAFKAEMAAAKKPLTFVAYPGAVHAFTQPEAGTDSSKGAAYDADADAKSWDAMKAFLKRVL